MSVAGELPGGLKLSYLNDSDLIRAVRQSNLSQDPHKCRVKWTVVMHKLLALNKGYAQFSEDQLRCRYKYIAKVRRTAAKRNMN